MDTKPAGPREAGNGAGCVLDDSEWLVTIPAMIGDNRTIFRVVVGDTLRSNSFAGVNPQLESSSVALRRKPKMMRNSPVSCCIWLGLPALILLAGCGTPRLKESLQRYEFKQPHMGTLFTITLYAPDEATARAGTDAAFAKIAALDRMMTDYDPESELMLLCRQPVGEPTPVSDQLFDVLQKAQRVAELTDGAFDVTIGPVVRLWRRARRAEALPSAEQLAHARARVGWQKLKLDPENRTATLTVSNMQLDLGGIAKGYAADQALEVLKRRGLGHSLVAASGDIAAGDAPPGQRGWRVGIGDPEAKESGLSKIILLSNGAVSTSGDREQFVEIGGQRYSHIVDPRTGIGLTETLQVSIVARHATDTDSFATAVSVLGVSQGMKLVESQPGLAALILQRGEGGKKVYASKRFLKLPEAK
jgi:FAD:protein FMN transferase